MPYRYRTAVLVGPWRDTLHAAARDAVIARQAVADDEASDGIRWTVPGAIEVDAEPSEPWKIAKH